MDSHLTAPTDIDCVTYDEADDVGALLTKRISRRRGLGVLAGAATALIGGLSSACGIIRRADPCTPVPSPACCHLASCIECTWAGSKDQYACPEGFQQSYWTCIDELGQSVVCGECTPGTSCFRGPFACSIWY